MSHRVKDTKSSYRHNETEFQPAYPPVLKAAKSEEHLLKNGYVVIRNFLPNEAIVALLEYNKNNQPDFFNDAILNTVWHTHDSEYKNRTVELITKCFEKQCQFHFKDFRLLGGAFVIKQPGPKAVSAPHFDLGIVDEESFRAFSIWVPLTNVNRQNGALMVVPKSHIFNGIFRGPNIPNPVTEIQDWLWDSGKEISVQAGDAVVYDHRLIHGSRANVTDEDRIVASCTLTSEDAKMVLYYLDDERTSVHAHEVNQEHFFNSDPSKPPVGTRPIKSWPYLGKQVSKADLPFVSKPPLISRIRLKLLQWRQGK